MVLRILPLLVGTLPLIAMFGAFWLGVANDVLPACVPPLDGCVSISATGRKPPGSFLFRAIMLPQAALLIGLWYFSVLWLRALNSNVGRKTTTAIMLSGLLGALALVVYVSFLGTKEPLYEFMRRTGIYFGFLGTALAQLLLALALAQIARASQHEKLRNFTKLLLGLCLATFVLGILNTFFRSILTDAAATENRIEWLASLLMQAYFFVLFLAWRSTGVSASIRIREARAG